MEISRGTSTVVGPVYERLVSSVRSPLQKIFAKVMLDAGQLTTVLAEIEAQSYTASHLHTMVLNQMTSVLLPLQRF